MMLVLYGFIPRFIRGESLSYAVGDASHAYQAHELSMKVRKDNTPNNMEVDLLEDTIYCLSLIYLLSMTSWNQEFLSIGVG